MPPTFWVGLWLGVTAGLVGGAIVGVVLWSLGLVFVSRWTNGKWWPWKKAGS